MVAARHTVQVSGPAHRSRVEKGGLGGQKETSQHKRLRDVEDRVQRPKLHVNVVLKRKQTNKEKQIFNDEMYYFLELLKDNIPRIKRQTQYKKKFRKYHSETEKHQR